MWRDITEMGDYSHKVGKEGDRSKKSFEKKHGFVMFL